MRELARRHHSEVVTTISRKVAALKAMNTVHRSKNIPVDGLWWYLFTISTLCKEEFCLLTLPKTGLIGLRWANDGSKCRWILTNGNTWKIFQKWAESIPVVNWAYLNLGRWLCSNRQNESKRLERDFRRCLKRTGIIRKIIDRSLPTRFSSLVVRNTFGEKKYLSICDENTAYEPRLA